MTWLALRALLARIPGIGLVGLLCLALTVAAGWSLYASGRHAGAIEAHRAALADSVHVAVARVDSATHRSNGAVAAARRRVAISGTGRAALRIRIADVSAQLEATSPAIAVLAATSVQLSRDSITIAVQAAAIDTLLLERSLRVAADSLEAHQIEIGTPHPKSHRAWYAAVGAGLVAVIIMVVR